MKYEKQCEVVMDKIYNANAYKFLSYYKPQMEVCSMLRPVYSRVSSFKEI
jgi:hypothetical protein